MKIAILGDPRRRKKDEPLVKEAELNSNFDEVVYTPINQVRFDISKRSSEEGMAVRFNGVGTNLDDFDCVVPVPTITHSELFYTAMWMLNDVCMPFDAEKYMMFMNNELLRNFLRSRKIPIRESITITSNMSLDQISNSIEFPVIVRPPKKRVVVNNPTTLKDVVSLYKYGTPIVIERPIKADMDTWIFVVGDEVVASYKKYQKKLNGSGSDIVVGSDLNKLAVRIRKEIGCDYCAIRFLFADGEWVVDKITLCPDFVNFQKMTGVNVARYVISHMARKITEKEKAWFKKVEKFFKLEIPHISKPHIPSIPSIPKPSMPKFPKIRIFGEDKDEENEQSEEDGKK